MIPALLRSALNSAEGDVPRLLGVALGSSYNPTLPEIGTKPGTGYKPAFTREALQIARDNKNPLQGGNAATVFERLEKSDVYKLENRLLNVAASASIEFLSGGISFDAGYSHAAEVAEKSNSYLWRLIINEV